MKIKEGFVVREIAGNILAVPTGDLVNEFDGIINLNKTAKFMWELLEKGITEEELINKLAEKYHINEQKAKIDVEKFLKSLQDKNILE